MLSSNVCLKRTYHGCTLQVSVILVLAVSLDVTRAGVCTATVLLVAQYLFACNSVAFVHQSMTNLC